MRLTLRTMLAYLDDILEPDDYRDIGKKIEESEFATGLVHRTRDVTRRLRLGAPKLSGRGIGLDANTVAEYLDNTLSAERVPDFEKVCLESDMHLAEVAACHQILTLVLGEPADVDPDSRRKMYELIHQGSEAAAEQPPGLATPPRATPLPPPLPVGAQADTHAADTHATLREKPAVPDYLREPSHSRWWAVVMALLLAVLLGGAVVLSLGPLDHTHPLAKLFGAKQTEPQPAADADANHNGDDKRSSRPLAPVTADGDENPNSDDHPEKGAPGLPPLGKEKSPVSTDDPAKTELPSGPGGDEFPNVDNTRPPPGLPPLDKPNVRPGDVPEVPVGRLGRFISDGEALLRLDAKSGEWQRVPPRSNFDAGDRLLVLPTFKPTISLAAGMTLQLAGETMIEFEPADADGVPTVRMPYGRMVVMTSGKPQAKLHLILGDQEGVVTLSDAELAVEVRRYLPPGADPERETAGVAVDLFVKSGQGLWTGSNGADHAIKAPERLILAAHPNDPPGSEKLPLKWVDGEPARSADMLAAQILNQKLDEKPSVVLSLRELADHRRWEVRSLAARCLALVGEFDTFVAVLNDPDQRSMWPVQIDSLQAALARGPDTAKKVRESFRKLRGEDGARLYRLLWSYSKSDLDSGAAAKLVEYLESESLDFRLLAFTDLKAITGLNFGYQPQNPLTSRQGAVRRWKDLARAGGIVPKPAASVTGDKTIPADAPGKGVASPTDRVTPTTPEKAAPAEKAAPSGKPAPVDKSYVPPLE